MNLVKTIDDLEREVPRLKKEWIQKINSIDNENRKLEILEKDGLIKLWKIEQRCRKRSIHIIDLNKKIKKNISEETINNLIKFSKKQVNTNNDVFSKKVTNNYIVTVDNIFPDDIIIVEKVNSIEKDSIGLLLF
ncbi:hypothetical protein PL327_16395 (plasmid) [Clostridium perfringens D]|nr:hypothetical protein [Clostridium perfringens]WEV23677.1 hypothetical protein PL327_16395 [Clostridium perfringens D]